MSPSPVPAPQGPRPLPYPGARGGNATPVNGPKPKRKRAKPPAPPRNQQPRNPGGTPPPSPAPYPQPHWPAPYNPATVAHQAQQAAQNAINQQLAAGMSALPTVQQQSAPYQQQIASEQGLGTALLEAMKGAQTYRVNLATGVPEAFSQAAATTGGDQDTAQRAASTLASYGTSAANQIAQQEAAAPAATAGNIRIINQRLQDLLSGPQGHDALARQLTSQIEQQRPGLELNYQNTYAQQAQVPFNEALQLATANTNYDLAQQTYGLNAQGQQFNQNLQQNRLRLDQQNTRLRELGLKLQNQRANDSYNLTIARLKLQAKIANQRNATQQQRADATAANQAQQALTRARSQIIQQANTLYKRTQGTGGSGGTYEIHYTISSDVGPKPQTERFKDQNAYNQRLTQLQAQAKDPAAHISNLTSVASPGSAGEQGQSAGYLRNQAVNYGVNLILQSAPWLPRAAATRMAQQLVAGVFGRQQQQTPRTPTHDTPPSQP